MDEVWDKVDCLFVDKHQSFYKFLLPFWVSMIRHAQIANQIAKFLKRLYLKKRLDCP